MKYIIKESQLVDIIKRALLEARGGNQVNGVEDVEDPRTIYGSDGSQPWHTQGETPTLPVVVISDFYDDSVCDEVIDLVSNPKLYAKKLKGKEIVSQRYDISTGKRNEPSYYNDYDEKNPWKAFAGGKGENYPLEIGSNTFIPGFEEGLIGMSTGEEKDLNLKFPENYTEELKGKDVVFKVKVNIIKERVLPELNEDFFKDLGYDDVKDAEGLKAKVKEQIKTRKEAEIENKYIDDCLKLAVSKMTVEINPEIIDEEIHRIIDQVSQQLKMNGLTLEQYMQFTGMTKEDLHKQYEETATNRVKERFLLEEVAKEEKIEISDKDADAKAEEMAKNYGMTKEDLLKEFGGLDMVKYDMKMREAINIVKGE